jgi:hypothetical protein
MYVDEQFRDNDNQLNLAWGHDWEHFREYEFQKIEGSDGVYMDTVRDDDTRRLQKYGDGGGAELNVAVGTFDEGDIPYSDDFVGVTMR